MENDFWGVMQGAFTVESAIDHHLQEKTLKGPRTTSLQALTDASRAASALPVTERAGTRVRFTSNVGSILTYDDSPADGMEGIIVTVRTGNGDTTHQDGNVFVLWDDGQLRAIRAEHLRLARASKRASSVRMVVSDLGDISSFFSRAGGSHSSDE